MAKTIKSQSMAYLLKETRRAKKSLWHAIERHAPEREIDDLRRKIAVLDWLLGVTIKEDDATR